MPARRLLAVVALLAAPAFVPAQATPTTEPPPDTGATVYQKVLRSTVWVFSERGAGHYATGSGSLVDRGRRLVLTNYHVVGDVKKATVYFPVYEHKKAISDKKFYTERRGKLGIEGEVLELDKQADLALIRLDRVPDGVPELPLAKESPDPGQSVHSVGNPGRSGALWVYTPGKVRQVYGKRWKAKLDEKTVATFEAKVVETDSATNPGDSGGPLVNDRGDLVGVTEGGAVDAQLLSTFIDVTEVRKLVHRRSVQALRTAADGDKELPAKKPGREAAVTSKDPAKFFGEEAWKKLQPAADRLFKEKKTDFVIETLDAPPKDADKVKGMSPTERLKYFREVGKERIAAEKVNGVFVLVCKSPGFVWVDITPDAAALFPKDFGDKLKGTLLSAFKEKKHDEGLQKAIDLVLDARGLGEKK